MLDFLKKHFEKKDNKEKVVVIGIDGVPCSLLSRFIKDGIMPNLANLVS
jgi:predicted AlkP superfamily phosphohydrolase/phosphomutase